MSKDKGVKAENVEKQNNRQNVEQNIERTKCRMQNVLNRK